MVVKKKRLGSPEDHFPNMLSNLSKLQTRDKFTDVVFHCNGGSVGAHKAFLGPLSPLLSNMSKISTRFQVKSLPTHLAREPHYNSNLHILARAALHTAIDVSGAV